MKTFCSVAVLILVCGFCFCRSASQVLKESNSNDTLQCGRIIAIVDSLYANLGKPDTLLAFASFSNWWGNDEIRFITSSSNNNMGYYFPAGNIKKYTLARDLKDSFQGKDQIKFYQRTGL